MIPRLGRPSDAEAVTNVILKTMPLDPQWNYRFPWRDQHPKDHYKFTRMLIDYFLNPDYDDWQVMVVVDALQPGGHEQVVSFAVWDVSFRNKRRHGPDYERQDRKLLVPAVPIRPVPVW